MEVKYIPQQLDTLTAQQGEAVDTISTFLKTPNEYLFVLKGYAGTGKTFCINYLLKHIIRTTVCCTAPTHAAARVIEKLTHKPSKTLQSLLGLRPNTDLANFDISNPQFDPKGVERIKDYAIIIVDECSQINQHLFTLISNRAYNLKTKIIFMGDECQLPPIRERISNTFKIKNHYQLTDIVRQSKEHPLHPLFEALRYDIYHNTKTFIEYIKYNIKAINKQNEGYEVLDKTAFSGRIIEYMKHDNFEKNINYARYTAYTNDNIQKTNNFIRNIIIGQNAPTLHPNDLLLGYTTLIDENMAPIITNSDTYVIGKITDYTNGFDLKTFGVNLINTNTLEQTRILEIIDHRDPVTFNRYKQLLNTLHYTAISANAATRSSKWQNYYKFKSAHLSLIDFDINGTTAKKDIDYGYGMTSYKIQGATINNMFINIPNMIYYEGLANKPIKDTARNPHAIEFMNKQIYTALSRTKDKAFILYY